MPDQHGAWTETILYSFTGGSDSSSPDSILTFDEAGNLYGTTLSGGSGGNGIVFELSPGTAFELTPTGNSWEKPSCTILDSRQAMQGLPRAA